MTHTKPRALRATALSLAVAGMLLTTSLYAGQINNSNNTAGLLGACGVDNLATADVDESKTTACVGAWNLDNVDVKLVRTADGTEFGTFDKATGAYSAMAIGDSFASYIKDAANTIMAKLTGKVWPVGEPTGIKAVYNDTATKNGKPQNCLINTSYLSAAETGNAATAYLDSATPQPVICSSEFQTHKRFKIAMQPATVDGVLPGAEGKPIDLVFNVASGGGLQPYQVFSKINNYTGVRLKGYKVVVGTGLGASFQSAANQGIENDLHISLGIGEGGSKTGGVFTRDGSDIFDAVEGLATFSHGLFGPQQLPHFPTNGFFDIRTAGFGVVQECSKVGSCATTYIDPVSGVPGLKPYDTIKSTTALPSNYTALFGDWLPSKWQPKGIFWDFDNNPSTDADLVAWWDGTNWRKNNDSGSAIVTDAEFKAWQADKLYAIDDIEDVLNLG
ncbi:MAG: choice-of-anchor F family protein, partial [Rhodoferax sp.]|nr:choice-of-anchor F family protein [Rhodoferax sp.]